MNTIIVPLGGPAVELLITGYLLRTEVVEEYSRMWWQCTQDTIPPPKHDPYQFPHSKSQANGTGMGFSFT